VDNQLYSPPPPRFRFEEPISPFRCATLRTQNLFNRTTPRTPPRGRTVLRTDLPPMLNALRAKMEIRVYHENDYLMYQICPQACPRKDSGITCHRARSPWNPVGPESAESSAERMPKGTPWQVLSSPFLREADHHSKDCLMAGDGRDFRCQVNCSRFMSIQRCPPQVGSDS